MYKPDFRQDEMRVRARHFQLPDKEGRKIAYTYIQKNGCSNFKVYLLKATGAKNWRDQKIAEQKISLPRMEQGRWDMRIFVYRDPLKRFISAFLNKFVREEDNRTVLENYEALTGRNGRDATCLDFLTYLESGLDKVDSHFLPQKAHLAETEYNMPIPLENLTKEMGRLLGTDDGPARAFSRPHNATEYASGNDLGALTDVPVKELESLIRNGNLLSSSNFETPQVSERIHELYKQDFEMFETLRSSRN